MKNLKISALLLGAAILALSGASAADKSSMLTIKNNTGLTLHGVLWQGNDSVHNAPNGPEWQYGTIGPRASVKADVPSCKFSFVVWDNKDLWHFEIHDCHSETLTISGKDDVNHVTLK